MPLLFSLLLLLLTDSTYPFDLFTDFCFSPFPGTRSSIKGAGRGAYHSSFSPSSLVSDSRRDSTLCLLYSILNTRCYILSILLYSPLSYSTPLQNESHDAVHRRSSILILCYPLSGHAARQRHRSAARRTPTQPTSRDYYRVAPALRSPVRPPSPSHHLTLTLTRTLAFILILIPHIKGYTHARTA